CGHDCERRAAANLTCGRGRWCWRGSGVGSPSRGRWRKAFDAEAQAAPAPYRFGPGPPPGPIAPLAADPPAARRPGLAGAGTGRIGNADLLTSGTAARVAFAFQQAQRAARQAERAAQQAGGAAPPQIKDQSAAPPPAPVRNPGPGVPQQIYLAEAKAR